MSSQLSYKILIVDDEIDIIELLSYNLKKENFTVVAAMNGKEAIQIAQKMKPDIILMDVMMPEMDGIEACRQIKSIPQLLNTPLIFLTARGEEFSELAGFEAGADDYIIKPIKPRVLISRLKAILRRNQSDGPKTEAMNFQDLKIDRESFSVTYKSKVLQFPKKEFELLSVLPSKPEKVFTREQILEALWGDDVLVVDRTIDVHIRKLREKLDDNYIQTIKGVGYKFEV